MTWLLAVVAVPVMYDPHGFNSFDPFKVAAIRVLALLMGGALVVRGLCDVSRAYRECAHARIWLLGAAAVFGAFVLATCFSIEPASSLWGSSHYQEGLLTTGCLLILFAGVTSHFRTMAQANRLVTAALLSSLPMCLYALMQRMGVDPTFPGELGSAATSFAGHPIYLAGYLLMLMPLCIWKLSEGIHEGRIRCISVWFYAGLLLLQIFAFVSTEKRGPQVALLVMVGLIVLLRAACLRRFRLVAYGLAIITAGGMFLTGLALAAKAGVPIGDIPMLGRLAMVVPVGRDTGDAFRESLWEKGPAVVMPNRPLPYPNGAADPWYNLRSIVGYGPETLGNVLPHYWLWVRGGPALVGESRFHNMFWETWESTGLLGLLAMFWLGAIVFAKGTQALALPFKIRLWPLFASSVVGACLLAVGLACLYGAGYFGLGFQVGFTLGLVGHVVWSALREVSTQRLLVNERERLLAIALLGALLGHQVDMAFAFTTANTTVLFWVFSGAIVGLGLRHDEGRVVARMTANSQGDSPIGVAAVPQWAKAGLFGGILTGALLIVILNGFLVYRSFAAATPGHVLYAALMQVRLDGGPSYLLAILVFPTWLAGSWLLAHSFAHEARETRTARVFATAALVSLGIAIAFVEAKATLIAAWGPIPSLEASSLDAVAQAKGYAEANLAVLGLLLIACFLAAGLAFDLSRRQPTARTSFPAWAGGLVVLAGVALAGWWLAGRVPRHEAFSGWAHVMDAYGRKSQAAALYRESLKIEPWNVSDRILCSKVLMERGLAQKGRREFSQSMSEAEAILLPIRRGTELNFGNYYLGRLYLRWALAERDAKMKRSLGLRGRDSFARATDFTPESETAWFEASLVDQVILHDEGAARQKVIIANALTRKVPATPWGDFYAQQAFAISDSTVKAIFAERAIDYFDRGLRQGRRILGENPASSAWREIIREETYRTLLTKGALQGVLGQKEAALLCFSTAARQGSIDGDWEAEALLARTHADMGDRSMALRHLAVALADAPADERPELEQFKLSLGGGNGTL